jgi:hypothetical protein
LELAKVLLGLHPALDRSMILLQDIIQGLDRSMSAAAAQSSFLLYVRDGGAVDRRLIGVDDARLRMGWLRALRNSRLAAAASRSADSRKSILAPVESMARYR